MSDQAVENVPNKATPKKDKIAETPQSKKLKRVIDEEDIGEQASPLSGEDVDDEPSESDTTINKFKQLHNRVGQIFRVMANGKNRKRNRVVLVPFHGCSNCIKQ